MKNKLLLIMIAALIAGCTDKAEMNKALQDTVNLNLALIAATPDHSLHRAAPLSYQNCYSDDDELMNGCSPWDFGAAPECVSYSQATACAALNIRLKKQGYKFDSSDFLKAYLLWQKKLGDERKLDEQNKINAARQALIESMANGK